jgi:hypothetical protein
LYPFRASGAREIVLDTDLAENVIGIPDTLIAPNATFIIQLNPQVPIRPRSLFIPPRLCPPLLINDFRIGRDSQLASSAPIPAELFAYTCGHTDCEEHLAIMEACIKGTPPDKRHQLLRHWKLEVVVPGIIITISVANTTPEPALMRGAIIGVVVE